ncbi:MAG TPA: hypothetical protein TECP_00156 [Hyphomicrobiaceae bacterium MAG_BT-2024]
MFHFIQHYVGLFYIIFDETRNQNCANTRDQYIIAMRVIVTGGQVL